MPTFFSGTDIATLKEEGMERNHFVSLIVNNAGKYTAAITRKIKYKCTRALSYETYEGTVNIPGTEVIEGEEIEYFGLDIEFEEKPDNQFNEVAERLKEIEIAKAKSAPKWTPNSTATCINYKSTGADNSLKDYSIPKQPTLFDDLDWEPIQKPKDKSKTAVIEDSYKKNGIEPTTVEVPQVTKELIDGIVNQLITGSVTVTKLDAETKKKLANTVTARFNNRFGKGVCGMKLFKYWATDFIEYLLWYSIDDPDVDELAAATEIAARVVEELKKLPDSEYIDEYINLFIAYADE